MSKTGVQYLHEVTRLQDLSYSRLVIAHLGIARGGESYLRYELVHPKGAILKKINYMSTLTVYEKGLPVQAVLCMAEWSLLMDLFCHPCYDLPVSPTNWWLSVCRLLKLDNHAKMYSIGSLIRAVQKLFNTYNNYKSKVFNT